MLLKNSRAKNISNISVPHDLIPYVMSYYHIPQKIITYITSLYSKLEGKVYTPDWESEIFQFLVGVFQGDPFSGIIVLTVFNPIIEHIKKYNDSHGYDLTTNEKGSKRINRTPFADNFNILSDNKKFHQ